MASTINAKNTSSGLVMTPDSSGQLELQTADTTRMTIDVNGNVGIGTNSPGARLDVVSDSALTGIRSISSAAVSSSSGGGIFAATSAVPSAADQRLGIILFSGSRPNSNYAFSASISGHSAEAFTDTANGSYLIFSTSPIGGTNRPERMRITSTGEVYIAGETDRGAYNLQCNGTGVWGAGAYVNGSDARIKEEITPIDSGLDVVIKLNPVTYKYREDWSKDQSTQTGFIAQELLVALEGKNYVDGIVQQGGEYMSVAYQNIIPILTKAIQELKAELDTVKTELSALKGPSK